MIYHDSFPRMCSEIIRIMKPGGEFIGSFNLEEAPSPGEPQRLNVRTIERNLLDKLEVQSYRITGKGPEDNPYAPFFTGALSYETGQEGFLWVIGRKPG